MSPADCARLQPWVGAGRGPAARRVVGRRIVIVEPRPLPSGVVTFVFTDIEGSTRLLKRLPDTAPLLFERHDDLVRDALLEHDGHVVGKEGDAYFAAFERVDDALSACAEAQRRIAAEPWPAGGEIRIRIGMHTGLAAPRRDNYVAMAVHQAARIVGVAHGGQIVVTDAALSAAAGAPHSVPLGRFRIRDFDQPEALYRIDVPGTPVVDRAVRATPDGGHNLVAGSTNFIGRADELEGVSAEIVPGRVVSLVGPGGTGKSRLAVELGLELAASWPDGVWMVELADVEDPALVAPALAAAVGVATPTDVDGELMAWASGRRALLILDNTEQHVETCADLAAALARNDGIAVLTTGREPLRIDAEVVHRLAPLPTPSPDDDPALVASSPAVALFVDRARAVRPDLDLDADTLRTIGAVCFHLDGLPLAIEIAATRVGVLGVGEILDGLGQRFDLLRSRQRTLPERHRTMENVLGWSCDLLEPDERAAFARLAVFGGSFTVDDAVAALADEVLPAESVPELVWSLADRSLIVADLSVSGTRYRQLETVWAYADRLLADDPARRPVVDRWAAALLDRIAPWFPVDRRWIGEVTDQLANVRSLLPRVARHDQPTAQLLACTIAMHHEVTHNFVAGTDEMVRAVALLREPTPARVALLTATADLHLRSAAIDEAGELLAEAAELRDRVGPPEWNDAGIDRTRGELLLRSGRPAEAIEVARRALDRPLSTFGRARLWNLLGLSQYSAGDIEGGFESCERELELFDELGYESKSVSAHANLAEFALRLGDRASAASHQLACLDGAVAMGQAVMLAYSALVAARLAADVDDWPLAVRLQAAGTTELAESGYTMYEADQQTVDELEAAAIDRLGRSAVEHEGAVGAALGAAETAELAAAVLERVRSTTTEGITS